MDDMIERVARALAKDDGAKYETHPKTYNSLAVAAIEAMRQPTAFMADSGDEIFRSIRAPRYYTIPVWHSMIDAALKERT